MMMMMMMMKLAGGGDDNTNDGNYNCIHDLTIVNGTWLHDEDYKANENDDVVKYPTFHLFVLLLCSSSLLRESEKNRQHNTIGLLTFPKLGFSM